MEVVVLSTLVLLFNIFKALARSFCENVSWPNMEADELEEPKDAGPEAVGTLTYAPGVAEPPEEVPPPVASIDVDIFEWSTTTPGAFSSCEDSRGLAE